MKVLSWVLGGLMVLGVLVFGAQLIASESGEVVVLHTDDGGQSAFTRLWVVDLEGKQWLRAGSGPGSAWFVRLAEHPSVQVERAGVLRRYVAIPDPGRSAQINAMMAAKYGWRDQLVSLLMGDRRAAVAIRLEPAD